jgi:hypothetical protein
MILRQEESYTGSHLNQDLQGDNSKQPKDSLLTHSQGTVRQWLMTTNDATGLMNINNR